MTNVRRTVLPLTALWFVLAAWQYARSATTCNSTAPMTFVYWMLLLVALGMPLILIVRAADTRTSVTGPPGAQLLAFGLASYVPATLALRLIEACGPR